MPRLLVPGCTLYSQLILRISSHIHCIPISGEIFEWNNLYSNSAPPGHSEISSVTISDQCWLALTGHLTLCWQGQSPPCYTTLATLRGRNIPANNSRHQLFLMLAARLCSALRCSLHSVLVGWTIENEIPGWLAGWFV